MGDGQPCKFDYIKAITFLSFVDDPDMYILISLLNHKLMDNGCNRQGCDGECRAITLDDSVGLKCLKKNCGFISKRAEGAFSGMLD